MKKLRDLKICIKGAGDLSTGVTVRLFNAGFRKITLIETEKPLAVRRTVTFSEAVYDEEKVVEGITAVLVKKTENIEEIQDNNQIPVLIDPKWKSLKTIKPDVVIDAIIAKKNLGTNTNEAPLVIALGPGFEAPKDAHCVVETNRGHFLGKLIYNGKTAENTGVPGIVMGYGIERVIWSDVSGKFITDYKIGDFVKKDEIIAYVDKTPVKSKLDGVIRGLLRSEVFVEKGTKIADVDPRADASYCNYVSEKSRAIGGAVLEAILNKYM